MFKSLLSIILQSALSLIGVTLIFIIASDIIRILLLIVVRVVEPDNNRKYMLKYTDMYKNKQYRKVIKALSISEAQDEAVKYIAHKEHQKCTSYYIDSLEFYKR